MRRGAAAGRREVPAGVTQGHVRGQALQQHQHRQRRGQPCSWRHVPGAFMSQRSAPI